MSEHWCPIHNTAFFKKGNMKSYAHPMKDENGNTTGWCNEPEKAEPKAEPKEDKPFIPAINPEKQASIEAQNARTALTSLMIAGKLTTASIDAYDPLEFALVSQLTDRAGVTFKGFKNKQGTMVDAAKAAGAVEKKQFPNLGAFLNKCHSDLGLERADVEKMLDTKLSASTDFDGAWVALQNMQ
jgi:hypothetical protein